MECCLQWKPRIQNVQGQRNSRKRSKAFYLSKSVIFQKDWKEDPFLLLQSHNFVTIQDLATIPSSYFLTIGQGLRNEGFLDASFQAGWISMLKERCKVSDRNPLHWCHCKLMSNQYHLVLLGHPQPKSSWKLSKWASLCLNGDPFRTTLAQLRAIF